MNLAPKWMLLPLGCLLAMVSAVPGKTIDFGGYSWSVRSGRGGPGPNLWDENNVWLDPAGALHLKIAQHDGKWSCAEVTMRKRLGFGRYQFQTIGRIDHLDDNVVLGLFNYPPRDVGPDATHEIDLEYARWGEAKNPIGNFTVWPVEKSLKQNSKSFPFTLENDQSTHRFLWNQQQLVFQLLRGFREDDQEEIRVEFIFLSMRPAYLLSSRCPCTSISGCSKALSPKNGQEVEVVVRSFSFKPPTVAPEIPVPPPQGTNRVTAAAVFEPTNAAAGDTVALLVKVRIAPGHWIYALDDAGTSNVPTALTTASEHQPFHLTGPWLSSPLKRRQTALGCLLGKSSFKAGSALSPGAMDAVHPLPVTLKYQVCNEALCWPPATIRLEPVLKVLSFPSKPMKPFAVAGVVLSLAWLSHSQAVDLDKLNVLYVGESPTTRAPKQSRIPAKERGPARSVARQGFKQEQAKALMWWCWTGRNRIGRTGTAARVAVGRPGRLDQTDRAAGQCRVEHGGCLESARRFWVNVPHAIRVRVTRSHRLSGAVLIETNAMVHAEDAASLPAAHDQCHSSMLPLVRDQARQWRCRLVHLPGRLRE